MSIEIECLMAETGVIRPRIKPTSVEKSVVLLEKLKKRLVAWILKPEIKPWVMPMENAKGEQPDAAKLRETLNHPADFTSQMGDMHDATEFQLAISDARAMLVKRWPEHAAKDALDDVVFQPGEDEQQDWLTDVAVVDDPERFILEVEMATLPAHAVRAFKGAYPEIYAALAVEADLAISAIDELDEVAEVVMQLFLETGQAPSAPKPDPEQGEQPAGDGVELRSDQAKPPSERASP